MSIAYIADLPKGIWFENARNRYRVKLYRNNVAYSGGYHKHLHNAIAAYEILWEKIQQIPLLKKGTKPVKNVLGGTLLLLIFSSHQERDPNNMA